MKKYVVGADVGGSHISCALFDLSTMKIVDEVRVERDVNNKAEADIIISQWVEALDCVLSKTDRAELKGVAFAMPGPFKYAEGIALFDEQVAKYEKLFGVNVAKEIASRLALEENTPIRFINDAAAFAVGESWVGVGKNTNKNVAFTLGTGFGSAFINNGLPVVEGKGVSKHGCVWHLPFQDSIADDYFSTRWFQMRWKQLADEDIKGVKCVVDRLEHNPIAQQLLNEYGENMAKFIGPWLKEYDAETLILGGNISRAYVHFQSSFEQSLRNQGVNTKVAISILKEDAAIIGCCRLLDETFYQQVKVVLPLIP